MSILKIEQSDLKLRAWGQIENPIEIDQLKQVCELFLERLQESIVGIYLYGSSINSGLGPESDLDLLVVITDILNDEIRQQLSQNLLMLSRPVGSIKRALEVTVLIQSEICAFKYPLKYELQYGEWLRIDLENGLSLQPQFDPDLYILLYKAQHANCCLYGTVLQTWLPNIPMHYVQQAMKDLCAGIILNWDQDADERNQILALCRILYTFSIGEIVSKDDAAKWVASKMQRNQAELLILMAKEYKGFVIQQDWKNKHADLQHIILFLERELQPFLAQEY